MGRFRTHCQFCGKGPFRSVGSHEWQCPENPDGKTGHYQRFKARPNGDTEQQGAHLYGQRQPPDPPEAPQPTPETPSESGSGRVIQQFTPTQQPPPNGSATSSQGASTGGAGYFCGACNAELQGNETYCPGCGIGPLEVVQA